MLESKEAVNGLDSYGDYEELKRRGILELKDLRYFLEIADSKSMRKAAANLYISQPSLTRSVHNLENEIGAALLVRTNKGVETTELGEGIYHYAQSILQRVDEITKLRTETLKYAEAKVSAAIGGIILQDDLMLRYYETIRANRTKIVLLETSVEKVVDHVAAGEAEIGIVSINNIQVRVLNKLAELKDLSYYEIGEGPLYVHVGRMNPLYGRSEIEVAELMPYAQVKLPPDYFSDLNCAMRIAGEVRMMDFNRTITINNYHAIINMVKRTDAFILGNQWQRVELEKGNICSIKLRNCRIRQKLLWMKCRRTTLTERSEEFLNLILKCYRGLNGDT
ncbi:LysR family transcriptional regulator [Lachnospiraceae bacterium LCP19S3_B12]